MRFLFMIEPVIQGKRGKNVKELTKTEHTKIVNYLKYDRLDWFWL